MTDENPGILSHVSTGTNNFARAVAFYDKVLPTLGCKRLMEHPGAIAYGKQFPEFWVQTPINGKRASLSNGIHIGFVAQSKKEVQNFYKAALRVGGVDDGAPGPRPDYGKPYYGCFVRDPDSRKIEAAFWDAELASK